MISLRCPIRAFAQLSILATTFLAGPAAAQEVALAPSDQLMEIRLADGSTLYGRVVEADAESVVVVTESGARVEVERATVVSARPAGGVVRDGSLWPADDADYRLFAGPTGRTLPGGTGSIGVIEVFFPYVAYGITDRIQVAAGTTVAPGIMAEVLWIEPRIGLISGPRANVSAGVVAFLARSQLDEGSVGALHLTGTFGGERAAVNAGLAWPFLVDEHKSAIVDPLLTLGGEIRVARRVKLMAESYVLLGDDSGYGLLSGGVRIFGDRLSADVGLAGLAGDDSGCCLPIVSFGWAFGGGR